MKSPQASEDLPVPAARPYRGESAESRQRQRRERLLEAAVDAFATHGLRGATMRDICSGARLSERYFYESFRNTGEVFDAIYDQLTRQMWRSLVADVTAAAPDIEAMGEAGLRAFFRFIQEDARRARIMLVDAISINQSNESRADAAISSYVDLISSALAPYSALTSVRANPRLIAHGIVGLAIHLATAWSHNRFSESLDDVVAHGMYAWRGLIAWLGTGTQGKAQKMSKAPVASKVPKAAKPASRHARTGKR